MGLAGCGKSTVAEILHTHYGYERSKLSSILKDMLRCIPGIDNDMIEGHLKEVPNMLLGGHTPRKIMQTLGTEWGRNMVDEDFWVDCWSRSIGDRLVTVEDVRFPNEVAAVRDNGGVIWKINRPQQETIAESSHSSEQFINIISPDLYLHNSGDMHQLTINIAELMFEEYHARDNRATKTS
jgi:hypothetical protein